MYLHTTYAGALARAQALAKPPFGPGLPIDVVSQATRLEVWGTSFKDEGPDYCEFRLFDHNKQLATVRVEGY